MLVVRPIQYSDYDDLYKIAIESGHGFTSLPLNETILKKRIERAQSSFEKAVKVPKSESYLFVIEDTDTGQVVGTSGIEASVGLEDAFYHYRLGKVVHSSHELNIYNTIDTLSLCNDYTGAAELCTLFLSEPYRINHNGRFLSKSRFLFMAEHKQRFSKTVIAEMRGVSDSQGRSPFWNWLEEHFFSMDFPTADYLTGIGKKAFIAELMPKFPIYVSLLNKDAQQVIGEVHKNTAPALKLLENEGFSCRGYVDIFDAGPTVEAKLKDINSVKYSQKMQVNIANVKHGNNYIVANLNIADFRAVQVRTKIYALNQQVYLPPDAAEKLLVANGDWVRILEN